MCASSRRGAVLIASLVVGLAACGGERRHRPTARTASQPRPGRVISTKDLPGNDGVDVRLKRELEQVARCFQRAVPALRSEPRAGELGSFLKRAQSSGKLGKACRGLTFGKGLMGKVWVQARGYPVTFRRAVLGEDHYGGGSTVLHIRYRFQCAGRAGRADVTIQRGFGKRP